jgi:DNA-binding NtrC family response regulator
MLQHHASSDGRAAPRVADAACHETDASPGDRRILIVDDDPIVAESIAELLRANGWTASTASTAEEALTLLADITQHARPLPQIVLTDVAMPGMDGLALIRKLRDDFPQLVPVVITGYGTIESAVEAIREGAFDYLSKPVVDDELLLSLDRALRQQVLLAENASLKQRLESRFGAGNIIGHDARMTEAMQLVGAVAPSKATALITGESGTGKSMIARAIHQSSPRKDGPYVEIHCGSIPETLLESELFGHVKGAFTGAVTDKAGRFLAADGGTLFIDEINSASPAMQMKLLRVLQERVFEPVGSTQPVEVDVRVVLATNEPLEQLVADGRFRQDLYYRINVVKIELPPLRDRLADVPLLIDAFVRKYAAEHEKKIAGLADDARDALMRYPFPGNVRELENAIERAVVLARQPIIQRSDLPSHVLDGDDPFAMTNPELRGSLVADGAIDSPDTPWSPTPLAAALEEPERRILLKALRANDWNRQQTADDLDINRTTLYKKMKALGLDQMAG